MRFPIRISCGFLLGAMLGCGNGDRNETAPVRGSVTLDGQRYTQGGSVLFEPTTAGKMATGKIQTDGTYELSTYTPGDGAPIGGHKVAVIPVPPPIVDDELELVVPLSIPIRYGSTLTSELAFEVKAGQENRFDIELKSE